MNILKKTKFFIFLILLSAATIVSFGKEARADVKIIPPYIVFDDKQRTAELLVINTGNEAAIFKLYFYNMQQTEAGGYTKIDHPLNPAFDPQQALVFSPKQVRLPPNSKQRVRLSLRRPADLPEGEYRTHLKLDRIAAPRPTTPAEAGKITTDIAINISFSVPVIVRQGANNDVVAKIGDVKLNPAIKGAAMMDIAVDRTGKFGTMGGLKVYWTAAGQKEEQIGLMNGFNIYPESPRRLGKIALTQSQISNGTLRVVYEGAGLDAGKIFDEKIIPVGN